MIDGISLLILMGIAMPLKYFAGRPEVVTYVGWIHGVIFISLLVAIFIVWIRRGPSWKWVGYGLLLFFAALIPFGPFFIDRYLAKEEADS
jgi:integral membrane protein